MVELRIALVSELQSGALHPQHMIGFDFLPGPAMNLSHSDDMGAPFVWKSLCGLGGGPVAGTRRTISLGPGKFSSVRPFPSLRVKFSETLTGVISPFFLSCVSHL